ncbi:hypothetical protein F2P81_023548 [Scophthalmus maximus]|uniref:Uncharacterized protein n=1 Tax=Scophthalmus maximus TaxID=52904 RepID=A0A6A4RQ41_SCOMX|nr:hypothetical protein F2P81_023548 [Scophthalmus maximus]
MAELTPAEASTPLVPEPNDADPRDLSVAPQRTDTGMSGTCERNGPKSSDPGRGQGQRVLPPHSWVEVPD